MKGERRMYEELIAKMNPCPKLNLQWYKNEDLYSDGEVEDFIIKIIAENRPEDYSNASMSNLIGRYIIICRRCEKIF